MTDQLPNDFRIDDFGPLPVVRPQTVADLTDVVRRAAAEGQAVYPVGGGTMLDLGMPPTKPGVAVNLTSLNQVIDYPARDMTITVQAGITIAQLREILAAEKQRLPIDVPLPERATLGGALATNMSGPRRYGWGTLRDYVIGISVVNDEGHEVKAGGRVVKNVAGYDMCKLYIGSLGTLGIITQVTLKLRPVPDEQGLITFGCEAAGLGALLDRLHDSRTRPVCLEVLNQAAAHVLATATGITLPATPWVLGVGFEGNREAITWEVGQLGEELSGVPSPQTWLGPTSKPLWHGLHKHIGSTATGEKDWLGPTPDALWHGLNELAAQRQAALSFKANLLPRAVADFCQQAMARFPGWLLQAHAGNGIVIGHAVGDLTLERAQAMLKELQTTAVAAQGNLVLWRCPSAWKSTLPVWGAARADAWLMREVKNKLDPRRLFNPGRFVDGI